LRLGRFEEGVKARRNALRLNGENAERQAALGEALVFAANGVVTAGARAAFQRAVALGGNHRQARYFPGAGAQPDGHSAQAAATWRSLIETAPADAPWVDFVRSALARVEGAAAPSGPTEDQVAAASSQSADERNAMVRGMVERLSERLHREGSDVE